MKNNDHRIKNNFTRRDFKQISYEYTIDFTITITQKFYFSQYFLYLNKVCG